MRGAMTSFRKLLVWLCLSVPFVSASECGDGKTEGDEECDDSNRVNWDGCDSSCNVEPGWTCDTGSSLPGDGGYPSVCHVCGDGKKNGVEECDDGNQHDLDGCGSSCTVEPGWTCEGEPSSCQYDEEDVPTPPKVIEVLEEGRCMSWCYAENKPKVVNTPWKERCDQDWRKGGCSACPECEPYDKCLDWCSLTTGRISKVPLSQKCALWWNGGACVGCDMCKDASTFTTKEDYIAAKRTYTEDGELPTPEEMVEMLEEGRCLNWCNPETNFKKAKRFADTPWETKCEEKFQGGACSACHQCKPLNKCLKFCSTNRGRIATFPLEKKCSAWWNGGACRGCDDCKGVQTFYTQEEYGSWKKSTKLFELSDFSKTQPILIIGSSSTAIVAVTFILLALASGLLARRAWCTRREEGRYGRGELIAVE